MSNPNRVIFIDLPLVPLSAKQMAAVITSEMRRRAFSLACEQWMAAHPGEYPWFVNGDVVKQLEEAEHA